MVAPIVLLMFVLPYALSSFRKGREKLSHVDTEQLVNYPHVSIVATNQPPVNSVAVLYRSA